MPTCPARPARHAAVAAAIAAALFVGSLAMPEPAAATFNKFLSARALTPGESEVGLVGSFGDVEPDYLTGYAFARRGLFRGLDGGVRLGALKRETPGRDQVGVLVAADARVQVLRESIEIPFDFAVDVAWTLALPGGKTYSDLAFAGLFSKTFERVWLFHALVPYLGAELVFLAGSARPGSEDTAAFGIAGVDLRFTPRFSFTPEVKAGPDQIYGGAFRYRF